MDNNNARSHHHHQHQQQQQQQQQQQLGVNKMGKSIKKSPLHQPSYANHNQAPSQPQPQVYNISKNDFRSIVQQLTGTGGGGAPPPPRPLHHHPKPPSQRLQRIRPPPLSPIARSPIPPNPLPFPAAQDHSFPPRPGPPAESPVSAYMRYLESSLLSARAAAPSAHPPPGLPSPLLPSPGGFFNLISPRSPYPLLSPGFNIPPPLSPGLMHPPPPLSQQGILGPGPHPPPPPSPGFFLPPSPGFFPQQSPGFFPPPSPGFFPPPSPSGFLPVMSPTWRDLL